MVQDVYNKVKNKNVQRYYILSTVEPIQEDIKKLMNQ
ncbi:MAG: hypothetical protein K0R54_4342 [Clostridiaceae bacterium]|jgi:hypothetical protein|nr:hypothetical protein [Clostridiaceae bacterium]